MTDQPDRWKCPNCGKIVVDPIAPIAACACGSERIQMREWPNGPEDWEAPDWPEDSEFSPDPHDVETVIEFESGRVMTDGGVDDSANATCHCGWPAEWHEDKDLCEVHAAEEWLKEGGLDDR